MSLYQVGTSWEEGSQCLNVGLVTSNYPQHTHTPAHTYTDGTGVKELWQANEPLPNSERQYGFTQFAMTLNEEDESERLSYSNSWC